MEGEDRMSEDNITVGSAHVDLGESFRAHAENAIRQSARKHLGDLTMASVHVAREGRDYRCSVVMQMGSLPVMTGEAQASEVPLAFKEALEKVDKQARRTKRQLREDKQTRPSRIITA
jgi:ribosomal subunit interface protein